MQARDDRILISGRQVVPMTDTKPQALRDLLASVVKLERNLHDAMTVAGERRSEIEPIIEKVQSILAQIETSAAGADDPAEFGLRDKTP